MRLHSHHPPSGLENTIQLNQNLGCFGGSDGHTLFITSAAIGKENEPEAGKVFAVHLPVKGVPCWRFGL